MFNRGGQPPHKYFRTMLIKEIKQALIGKTISYYDGWCGSSNYIKIGYLKKDGSSIRVFPEKGKGGVGRIYPPRPYPGTYRKRGCRKTQ